MKSSEFLAWLRGYAEGHREMSEDMSPFIILERLAEVTEDPPKIVEKVVLREPSLLDKIGPGVWPSPMYGPGTPNPQPKWPEVWCGTAQNTNTI